MLLSSKRRSQRLSVCSNRAGDVEECSGSARKIELRASELSTNPLGPRARPIIVDVLTTASSSAYNLLSAYSYFAGTVVGQTL